MGCFDDNYIGEIIGAGCALVTTFNQRYQWDVFDDNNNVDPKGSVIPALRQVECDVTLILPSE